MIVNPVWADCMKPPPWSLVSSWFIQVHLWVPIHWNVSKIIRHWQIRLPTWYPLYTTPIIFNGGITDQSIPRSSILWCELLVLPCWIDNFVSRRSISKKLSTSRTRLNLTTVTFAVTTFPCWLEKRSEHNVFSQPFPIFRPTSAHTFWQPPNQRSRSWSLKFV